MSSLLPCRAIPQYCWNQSEAFCRLLKIITRLVAQQVSGPLNVHCKYKYTRRTLRTKGAKDMSCLSRFFHCVYVLQIAPPLPLESLIMVHPWSWCQEDQKDQRAVKSRLSRDQKDSLSCLPLLKPVMAAWADWTTMLMGIVNVHTCDGGVCEGRRPATGIGRRPSHTPHNKCVQWPT